MRPAQRLMIGGVVLLATTAARAQNDPAGQVKDVAGGKPTIELVFVIDTTGSMGGLIEGAKQKVWGIVNDVMKSPARPEVRMGLVAYRDHGDAYITQILPVTRDLDKVYNTLMAYKADGGGDTPEDVQQGLHDALAKPSWRGPDTVKLVFLVGDATPHLDYTQDPDYVDAMVTAAQRGIKIESLAASGLDDQGEYIWRQLAQATLGQFVFLTYGANDTTTHHVSGYTPDTLDDLIVRLIAGELSPGSSATGNGVDHRPGGQPQQ